MSNFASKPETFSPYIPKIDTQVYAEVLGQHEKEYELGLQKVESYRDSIAGIPATSIEARKYIQEKVNQLTSTANERMRNGVDWSDQTAVKDIGSLASSIYNDEGIQTEVANAAKIRSGMSDMKTDEKITKGANALNKRDYLEKYQQHLKNGKVGDSFDHDYFSYVDVDKQLQELFKEKHPNTRITQEAAGYEYGDDGKIKMDASGKPTINYRKAIQEWDEVTRSWKGVSQSDVEKEAQLFLKTNPLAFRQLTEINAKYSNMEVGPVELLKKKKQVLEDQKEGATQELQLLSSQFATMPKDAPHYKEIDERVQYLKDKIDNELAPALDPENLQDNARRYLSDPRFFEADRKDIYMKDWMNLQVKKYAYGEEDVKFAGSSPSEKQHWESQHALEVERVKIARETLELKEKQDAAKQAAAELKQKKEYEDLTVSTGIDTKHMPSPSESFQDLMNTKRVESEKEKHTLAWDKFHMTNPDWFDEDGNLKADAKSGEDAFQKMLQAYRNGNGKDNDGKKVDIDDYDRERIEKYLKDDNLANAMKRVHESLKSLYPSYLQNIIKTNPQAAEEARKLLEVDDAAKTAMQSGIKNVVTSEDILGSYNAADKLRSLGLTHITTNEVTGGNITDIVSEGYEAKALEVLKKFGINSLSDYYNRLKAGEYYKIDRDGILSGKGEGSMESFKDKYLTSKQYLENPQRTLWVDNNIKDRKTTQATRDLAITLADGRSPIIKSDPDNFLAYYQQGADGKKYLIVKDKTGANEDLPMEVANPPKDWKDFSDEGYISQLLKANHHPTMDYSTTYGYDSLGNERPHTFEYAEPLPTRVDSKKNPVYQRYAVTKRGGVYIAELWQKIGDRPPEILKSKNGEKAIARATSIKDLERKIDNYKASGSFETNPYLYTKESSTEEEQDN